ncbi:MAG TPA: hypothetical protein ENG42_00595 [Candidatus Aenigmarchaeota archaeon]|nr:MAG: hypothetical protein DRP03_00985 [Candidatus Aenigmarchaeota archaeon]HDD45950.1 hypothetical protein [Candidatus Aenigmarchaeota archaeon]
MGKEGYLFDWLGWDAFPYVEALQKQRSNIGNVDKEDERYVLGGEALPAVLINLAPEGRDALVSLLSRPTIDEIREAREEVGNGFDPDEFVKQSSPFYDPEEDYEKPDAENLNFGPKGKVSRNSGIIGGFAALMLPFVPLAGQIDMGSAGKAIYNSLIPSASAAEPVADSTASAIDSTTVQAGRGIYESMEGMCEEIGAMSDSLNAMIAIADTTSLKLAEQYDEQIAKIDSSFSSLAKNLKRYLQTKVSADSTELNYLLRVEWRLKRYSDELKRAKNCEELRYKFNIDEKLEEVKDLLKEIEARKKELKKRIKENRKLYRDGGVEAPRIEHYDLGFGLYGINSELESDRVTRVEERGSVARGEAVLSSQRSPPILLGFDLETAETGRGETSTGEYVIRSKAEGNIIVGNTALRWGDEGVRFGAGINLLWDRVRFGYEARNGTKMEDVRKRSGASIELLAGYVKDIDKHRIGVIGGLQTSFYRSDGSNEKAVTIRPCLFVSRRESGIYAVSIIPELTYREMVRGDIERSGWEYALSVEVPFIVPGMYIHGECSQYCGDYSGNKWERSSSGKLYLGIRK